MQRILLAIAVVLLGGCATSNFDRMNPLPEHKQKIAVSVSSSRPWHHELPNGVYQIPDTRIYLSGHQRGRPAGISAARALVLHSAGQSRGKELVGGAGSALKTDLVTATNAVLADKIKQHGVERAFMVAEGTVTKDAHSLSVLPYIVLTFVSETKARPFVVLRASLRDAGGKEIWIWWSRYVSVVNDDRPLTGDDSWSKENAKALREAVASALDSAVDVLARDLTGKLARSLAKDVKLKGRYAFMSNDIELAGKLVGTDEKEVIFIPQISDHAVFAGINIFPKDLVQIRK
jgi:hypothetical protein